MSPQAPASEAGRPLREAALCLLQPTKKKGREYAKGVYYWRRWELRGTNDNHEVMLFTSADERTFNQVGRGLRRAIEDSGLTASP
jgi:hypothetical protein